MVETAIDSRRQTQPLKIEVEQNVNPQTIPKVVALENRCFQSIYRPHRFDAGDFEYYFGNPNTINQVATVDSTIVGYILGIVGSGARRHLARIHSIAVDQSHRNRGVGTCLIEEFIRQARRRGCLVVHTEVAASPNPGRRLFAKYGFGLYRRLPDYYGKGVGGVRLRLMIEE